jgi:hypothetical protein
MRRCLFIKRGKCSSDYGNKIKCDGLNTPEKCPYKQGSFAMKIKDDKNKRKELDLVMTNGRRTGIGLKWNNKKGEKK